MRSVGRHLLIALFGLGLSVPVSAAPHFSVGVPSKGDKAPDKTETAEQTKQGRITIVRGLRGGEAQLTDAKGKHWILVGGLRGELVRLGGHTVKVVGVSAGKKLMVKALRVSSYEIVDSGGKKPWVGGLIRDPDGRIALKDKDGQWQIAAGKALTKSLAKRIGCKVWIAGELADGKLRAEKFGWLRCKPAKVVK